MLYSLGDYVLFFQKVSLTAEKTYDDGKYEGELSNGLRHGKGKFSYSNGDVYDGEWKDDKPHGFGTIYYRKDEPRLREKYVGEFKHGQMEGKCTLYWNQGQIYIGEFSNNMRNGYGIDNGYDVKYYRKGHIYKGNWLNNKRSGYGEYYELDGTIYKGFWLNDQRHGRGILIRGDNIIDGEWKEGQRHDKFSMYKIYEKYEQFFNNDVLVLSKQII